MNQQERREKMILLLHLLEIYRYEISTHACDDNLIIEKLLTTDRESYNREKESTINN